MWKDIYGLLYWLNRYSEANAKLLFISGQLATAVITAIAVVHISYIYVVIG